MNIAYFDCFSGISGDMILGALTDTGVSIDSIGEKLKQIDLQGYRLLASHVERGGITGTKVDVLTEELQNHHIGYKDIKELIEKSRLVSSVKSRSLKVFEKIAGVEAKIHNTTIDKAHFHEVGAIDSIVDIVGSIIGLEMLGVDKVISSPVNTGSGMVTASHGNLPIPAPATAELLKNIPCYSNGVNAELTTPTGAAVISSLADEFTELPMIKISRVGYGAGSYNSDSFPNMLRIIVGDAVQNYEELIMLETNIDDMNPEFYDYIFEKGFSSGALDIFLTPIIMKKGRPAAKLSVLTGRDSMEKLTALLFKETSSFGIRVSKIDRIKIERDTIKVITRFGDIKVKTGKRDGKNITVSPEYDDCKVAAEKSGASIKEVYEEAKVQAWNIGLK